MNFDSTFAAINEFGQVDYAPHNKGITPVFFVIAVPDPAATERAGHPVSRDMEQVRLYIVGDSLSVASHPVDEGIKRRFPEEYEKWKRTKTGADIKGMRLAEWPMATPAMIAELGALNIFSVEDLAAVSDGNIQNVTDGWARREKAIAWLAKAKDGAAVMKYAAENDRLREDLKEAMARLSALEKHAMNEGYQPLRDEPRRPRKQPKAVVDELLRTYPELRRAAPRKKKHKSAMSPERRAEIGARLKAGREAAKAHGLVGVSKWPTAAQQEALQEEDQTRKHDH